MLATRLPGESQLISVCCTGVLDSDVTASYYSSYHMHLPICVSIVLNYFIGGSMVFRGVDFRNPSERSERHLGGLGLRKNEI